MIGDAGGKFYSGFFKSTNAGINMTWSQGKVPCFNFSTVNVTIDGTASGAGSSCGIASTSSQSIFDQALAIDPASASTVFFGGIGFYESSDGGSTWTFLVPTSGSNQVIHEDQHALAFDPFNSNNVYIGNDGGLALWDGIAFLDQNDNGFSGRTPPSSALNSGQLYGVSVSNSSPFYVLGGFQDNGTEKYDQPKGPLVWDQTDQNGDAAMVQVAPADANYAYHTVATLNPAKPTFFYSTNGGGHFQDASAGWQAVLANGDAAARFPPFGASILGSSTPHRVLTGAHKVYSLEITGPLTTTWNLQSSTDLTAGCPAGVGDCALQDIEMGPDGGTAWAVSVPAAGAGYKVSCTNTAYVDTGGTWTDVTGNLTSLSSSQFPSGITLSPLNSSRNYTTYLTMFAPAGSTSPTSTIFKATTCQSPTWTALSSPTFNGEPLSVLRLLVDNTDASGNTLLAGTDIGVFRSTDGGSTWSDYGMGIIPRVPVTDLEQNSQGIIAAATHGSGAYILSHPVFIGSTNVESECPSSPCVISVPVPVEAATGDVLLSVLDTVHPSASPTVPNGWTSLPVSNHNRAQSITATDSCGNQQTEWVYTHVYNQANDGAAVSFSVPLTAYTTCNGTFMGEFGTLTLDYRYADQNSAHYVADGYPGTTDGSSASIGPLTPASDVELLGTFKVLSDDATSPETGIGFNQCGGGSPIAMTPETPLVINGSAMTMCGADLWTGPNVSGSFGPFIASTLLAASGLELGWAIQLPPL